MVIELEVAVELLTQLRELVNTQDTTPLLAIVEENVGELLPTLAPLICHWYDGVVPPLVGVAVKLRELFGQVGLVPEVWVMLMAGETGWVVVMVMALEVAGFAVTPGKLEVITQLTT